MKINVTLKMLSRVLMKKVYVFVLKKNYELYLKFIRDYRTSSLNGLKMVVRDLERMNVSIVEKKVVSVL